MELEHVELENTTDKALDLSGYTLTYADGREYYAFSELVAHPQATVLVTSVENLAGGADSCPPIHLRGAGFDAPVLNDDTGTVSLLTPNGDVLLRKAYKIE